MIDTDAMVVDATTEALMLGARRDLGRQFDRETVLQLAEAIRVLDGGLAGGLIVRVAEAIQYDSYGIENAVEPVFGVLDQSHTVVIMRASSVLQTWRELMGQDLFAPVGPIRERAEPLTSAY